MTEPTKRLSKRKKLAFYLIIFLIPLTTIAAAYIAYAGYRTAALYRYVKHNERGWSGRVYRADPELGFAPIPNSRGAEVFPIGDDVAARFDEDGFRIPLEESATPPNQRPVVLALGCSFTYGAATPAENTYPYLVGQSLGGVTRNAGVPSYGLSQMLVLARKLIPSQKPDYLLVQYSPWLVQRAQTPFASTYFGKVPAPYFFESQHQFVLQPAVFRTKVMDLPADEYRKTPASVSDRGSFLWTVGLPLFIHDDFKMSYYYLNKTFGRVPEPAGNSEQLEKYVYEEIAKAARANQTKLVVVILGSDQNPLNVPNGLLPGDALVVNAQEALLAHLPVVNPESYAKSYFHWRGSPLRMVDTHPNETAHKIIAEAIVQKLKDETKVSPDDRPRK